MLKLSYVFSDNALFLHSSPLEVKGYAENCESIEVCLLKDGEIKEKWSGESDSEGRFAITIQTPAASYDEYSVRVRSKDDEKVIDHILFGELWLACGQSNMEMSHTLQLEREEILNRLKPKHIRGFSQKKIPQDGDFPFEPLEDIEGNWRDSSEEEFSLTSAVASLFSEKLYDFFAQRGENCPVGFLNTNRGGTCIQTWIPAEKFSENDKIAKYAPKAENWNTHATGNYQQASANYNYHMAPLLGVKARGMLWYQGESNVGSETENQNYMDFLAALREGYKERFSSSSEEIFPIMSIHIFPWRYTNFNDTRMGFLNNSFSTMAKKFPDEYPCIPICDLPPLWGKWGGNHPIHPIHKYKIGERLGLLALNKYYGRKVKNLQTLPAMLKSCVRHGNKLRLTFDNVGSGLYVTAKNAVGLYIRSKDGAYTPARYEIVAKNVMNVYHPYVDKPCHVAYAISSMETGANIFAGEFPVVPFCTEFSYDRTCDIKISLKPWLNNELDSAFVGELVGSYFDFFNRAIFNPAEGSGICYDSDFTLSDRSLRVYAINQNARRFGTYIRASQYATLDFENYRELKFSLFHHADLTTEMLLHYREEKGTRKIHKIKAAVDENGSFGWYEHSFDLSAIPEGIIEKAEFFFTRGENRLSYVFVDNMILVPKN